MRPLKPYERPPASGRCPLLDKLPPEIRLVIYELALPAVEGSACIVREAGYLFVTEPALLRTGT